MLEYLQKVPNLTKESNTDLGIIISSEASLSQLMIEKIIGRFMGSNARKGYTYSWIPNHLQDAGGKISPRSFLKLFSLAAGRRLEKFSVLDLDEDKLLEPSDLQGALVDTSNDRISELAEEYPWLEPLKRSLNGLKVPVEAEIFMNKLQQTHWIQQPPTLKPEEVMEYLRQLRIIEIHSDKRVNMPEIYMYGFGVKRSGGVKRPK